MNKAKLMFFVSCPKCKHKYGVEPKYILMYLSRVYVHYKDRFGKISQMLEAAQQDIKARTEVKKEGAE